MTISVARVYDALYLNLMTTHASKPVFLIRFADGTYAGSPLGTRTSNPETAGCFRQVEEVEALHAAQYLGGVAVLFAYSKAGRLVECAAPANVLAFVRA